jgi:hypothetical protein
MRLETAGTCFNQHRRSINSVQKLSDTPTELGTFARASGKIEEELESGHTRFPWKQSMPGPPSSSLTSYINELGVKVSYVDPNRMASGDSLEYLREAAEYWLGPSGFALGAEQALETVVSALFATQVRLPSYLLPLFSQKKTRTHSTTLARPTLFAPLLPSFLSILCLPPTTPLVERQGTALA